MSTRLTSTDAGNIGITPRSFYSQTQRNTHGGPTTSWSSDPFMCRALRNQVEKESSHSGANLSAVSSDAVLTTLMGPLAPSNPELQTGYLIPPVSNLYIISIADSCNRNQSNSIGSNPCGWSFNGRSATDHDDRTLR